MLSIAIRTTFEAVSFVAFLVLLFSGTYLANEIYLAVKRANKDKLEVKVMDTAEILKQKIITALIDISDTKTLKTIYRFILGLGGYHNDKV